MPQVTVYIRNEDLDKWKSIVKKSEFIHESLNLFNSSVPESWYPEVRKEIKSVEKIINTPKDIPKKVVGDYCSHGFDRRFCKYAKNGKLCLK